MVRSALEKFAPVRFDDEKFALPKLAPANVVPVRVSKARYTDRIFAPEKLAFVKEPEAVVNVTEEKFAPERLAPANLFDAPKLAPVKFTLVRFAFRKSVPEIVLPPRSAPMSDFPAKLKDVIGIWERLILLRSPLA